ncbi:bifunctional DNA primase/polymerase [Polymorphospora lycopeni]|uniref:Bifunctional DNA primase/polymerase n=1 Tax=Polymorphospora lycopeni TaxID=3140240 RepID=A0ABV5CY43_9ACTN
MSDLLTAALGYAERGWHVFPLIPDDKRPAFPARCTAERCDRTDPRCHAAGRHVGWEERATVDPARIRRAWSARPYGVGIACGPSGLVVVDLDTPKPDQTPPAAWRLDGIRDGSDVFTVIAERAEQPVPDLTYTVTTGRGGTHLYYRHPTGGPDLRNTAGRLGWLVDTRAHGGYVVAAGSTANGQPYVVAVDLAPMPLPRWLAGLLAPAPMPPARPVVVDLNTDRTGRYLAAAIRRETARVTDATEGERNRCLYIASVALGQLVAGGALAEDDAEAVLGQAATRAGLGRAETARTVRSGLTAGRKRPRTVAA